MRTNCVAKVKRAVASELTTKQEDGEHERTIAEVNIPDPPPEKVKNIFAGVYKQEDKHGH